MPSFLAWSLRERLRVAKRMCATAERMHLEATLNGATGTATMYEQEVRSWQADIARIEKMMTDLGVPPVKK